MQYTTRDVAHLLQIPETRIRSYARAGFVQAARGEHNEDLFSFQDLVLLRTAADLARQRVSARRISAALTRLKEQLPQGRPLSELRIETAGAEIIVTGSGEPPWNPGSGQFHIEFDTGQLTAPVSSIAPAQTAATTAAQPAHSAQSWFERGLELDAISPGDARHAYTEALRLEPDFDAARVNLGRL